MDEQGWDLIHSLAGFAAMGAVEPARADTAAFLVRPPVK